MGSEHLVPVKPHLFNDVACPNCGTPRPEARNTVFPGIHVMASYRCASCQAEFLRDLPVGFAVEYPAAIDLKERRWIADGHTPVWIHHPLESGFREQSDEEFPIERIVHRERNEVIILNTLDYLYGHVLLKLYNATYYLDAHPEKGLVLIVPHSFKWLVPEGVAEVWAVKQGLGRAQTWSKHIDAFVQERIAEYDKVHLGKAYGHPDMSSTDIARYTKVAAFPLGEFEQRVPEFTFVLRQDRLWHGSSAERTICRAFGRIGWRNGPGAWFLKAQDRLVKHTMRTIREQLPEARFNVVGLGAPGGMPSDVNDLRTERMDEQTEKQWCQAYARSHAVIGVHGSNMLLPTAHAAGCIEILPDDRLGNIVQDITVRHADRMQLFLIRFLDEFADPATVARHAVAMIRDFGLYERNNRVHVFEAGTTDNAS